MELEELKKIWLEQQQKYQPTEDDIKRIIHSKTKSTMTKLRNTEWIGICLYAVVLAIILANFKVALKSNTVAILYGIAIAITVFYMILQAFKLQLLHSIRLNDSVAKTLHSITRYRAIIVRERLWGLVASPFMLAVAYELMRHIIEKKKVLPSVFEMWIPLIGALIVVIVVSLFLFSKLQFEKIDLIREDLDTYKE